MTMTTKSTITHSTLADAVGLDFEPDELIDGRSPIEMIQYNAIYYFTYYIHELMRIRDKAGKFILSSNHPVRPRPDNLRISLSPDLFFAYVDDPSLFLMETGYNIWQVGKPPDVVIEVASPSTYRKDIYEKPAIYASMGIPEYWLFDPTGGELYGQALMGYRLMDGEYVPIEIAPNEHGLPSGYSDVWNMRLCGMARQQRGEILKRQPFFVFYEDVYAAELLLQDVETGLYIINPKGIRAELDAALADKAERDAAIAERDAEIAQRDARIRELEEENRRMRG